MIATSHVIIGGAAAVAVGTITQNPAAALAVGIVSHLICDAIPHLDSPINPGIDNAEWDRIIWSKGFYAFAITDSLIAFFCTFAIWYIKFDLHFWTPYAWGALGAYLPDLVDNVPLWRSQIHAIPVFKQFYAFHIWIHENWRKYFPEKKYWPLGIATQLITVLPCLYYLIK